jgi:hypothetical protein
MLHWFIIYSLQISLLLSPLRPSLVSELINQFPLALLTAFYSLLFTDFYIHVFSLASSLLSYLLCKLELHQDFNIYNYNHMHIKHMYTAMFVTYISTSLFNTCALCLTSLPIIICVSFLQWNNLSGNHIWKGSEQESATDPQPYLTLPIS